MGTRSFLLAFLFLPQLIQVLNAKIPSNKIPKQGNGVRIVQNITQPVDHFNTSSKFTFQQRYWYNDAWFTRGTVIYDNLVFLMLGGEHPGRGCVDNTSGMFFTQLAQDYGAMVFNLEHRYYGASIVAPDLRTSFLKYLTSQQALADVKNFIDQMTLKFLLFGCKWIVFGGSYAGALAVRTLQFYPDVTFAAIVSSPLLQAVVNNNGYFNTIKQVLSNYDVQGLDCFQALNNGFLNIDIQMATSNGRQQLFKGFRLCQPLNTSDQDQMTLFNYVVLYPYMYSVTNGGYGQYCDKLAYLGNTWNISSMYEAHQMFYSNVSCVDTDYAARISALKNTAFNNYERAWLYQSCNEFGWFPGTDNGPFSDNLLPVNWFVKQCTEVFGSNNATIYSNIEQTNQYYGANYNGSNVVFIQGTADPWITVGPNAIKVNENDWGLDIENGWHCEDMNKQTANETQSLAGARTRVKDLINLMLDCSVPGFCTGKKINNF